MTKNNLPKIILALGMPFLIAGACTDPTMKMKTEKDIIAGELETRYEVRRVEVFEDDLAYDGKRGIYEIIDHKTGQQYLGISGIGITEVGTTGKTTTEQ